MKYYISGKISGLDYETARVHFDTIERKLVARGHTVVNPMELDHTSDTDWWDYMETDIAQLLTCDGIVLLSDWELSPGARIEKLIAERLSLLVAYEEYLV